MCFPQGLGKVEVHMDHLVLSTMPPCHSSMLIYTLQLFLAHYTLRGVHFCSAASTLALWATEHNRLASTSRTACL